MVTRAGIYCRWRLCCSSPWFTASNQNALNSQSDFMSQCVKVSVSTQHRLNAIPHGLPLKTVSANFFTLHKFPHAKQIQRKSYLVNSFLPFQTKVVYKHHYGGAQALISMELVCLNFMIWVGTPLGYCGKCHYDFWRGPCKHGRRGQAVFGACSPYTVLPTHPSKRNLRKSACNIWSCSNTVLKGISRMISLHVIFDHVCADWQGV